MAMKSLSELRSLFKAPLLSHRWQVEIPTWCNAVTPSNTDLLFLVSSSGVPSMSDSLVSVELGSFKFNYNGKVDRSGSITWTLPENTDFIVANFFNEYAKKRQNYNDSSDLLVSSSSDDDLVISVIKLRLLDNDNSSYIGTYELYNCYFTLSGGTFAPNLSQDASKHDFSVTVNYDAWTFTPGS